MNPRPEDVDFLEHFGVKGMHWGVRNDRATGVDKKTDKEARKDAEEFARARQFYGLGAGTRRKHIRESVDAKSKKNADYKKAFDYHLGKQDASTHVEKAKKERTHIDKSTKRKQRAGALARNFTGERGTQAAFTVAAVGGAAYLRSGKGQKHMKQAVSAVSKLKASREHAQAAKYLNDYFTRFG